MIGTSAGASKQSDPQPTTTNATSDIDLPRAPDQEREPKVPTRPIELTVAFTDLEDFTTYTEAEGDEAARRLLVGHHRGSDTIVRRHEGRVLKHIGDGLMLAFWEPAAAVLACLELAEVSPLRLRAGIHCGDVLVTGRDLIGHTVNLTARITESAGAGQLIVTDDVRAATAGLGGVAFDGPYRRSLKGIERPVSVHIATRHERPVAFDGVVLDLFQRSAERVEATDQRA